MATINPPIFRGYVAWHGEKDSPLNGEPHIRKWLLERFLFELVTETGIGDLRDIGESLEGRWSAYTSTSKGAAPRSVPGTFLF